MQKWPWKWPQNPGAGSPLNLNPDSKQYLFQLILCTLDPDWKTPPHYFTD